MFRPHSRRQGSGDPAGRRESGRPPGPGGGARPLGEVLGDLFVARGLGRHRTIGELESAWAEAAGPRDAARTRVLSWRHGVLTVLVGHPALHEELAAFRKAELLAGLRARLPHVRLLDLRFRVGDVGGASADVAP